MHSRSSENWRRLQLLQRDKSNFLNSASVHSHIILPGRQDAREHAPHRGFGTLSQSPWHNNHIAQMMDASSPWNGQDQNLSSASHDDFQFLDIGMNNLNDGLNFDFQDYNGQHNGQMLHQEGGGGIDTRMDIDVGILEHKDTVMRGQMPPMSTAPAHSSIAGPPLDRGHSSTDSLVELDAQIQYLQQQRQQHQQRQLQEQQQRNNYYAHNRMVPPTPNSIEMHSANNQFYSPTDPQQQALYERYQGRLKEQEVCILSMFRVHLTNWAVVDGIHTASLTSCHST